MFNLIYCLLPTISMIVGFYVGFEVGKEKELPEIKSPAKMVEENKKKKKEEKQKDQLNAYIENIDNYPFNQKDIKE